MIKRILLLILTFILMIGLYGCIGGGGSEESSSTFTPSTTTTLSLSGVVDLSQVSDYDLSKLGLSSTRTIRITRDDPGFEQKVHIYTIGKNGELVPLKNVTCEFTETYSSIEDVKQAIENGEGLPFTCNGKVSDGFYIVRYVFLNTQTKQALELKADITVENGVLTVHSITLDPKVTVVAEALIKQVVKTLASAKAEVSPKTIIAVVKTIEDTVKNLIDSGVIQVNVSLASPVNETDIDKIMGLEENATPKEIKNAQLETIVGDITSNEQVSAKVTQTIAELKFDEDLGAKEYIYRLFDELIETTNGMEKMHVPSFIKDFFVEKYKKNFKIKVGDILNWFEVRCYNATTYTPVELGTAIQPILDDFVNYLKSFYTALENPDDPENAKFLNQVPQVIFALFPKEEKDKWLNISNDTYIDVPHAIAMIAYYEHVWLPEKMANEFKNYVCTFDPTKMLTDDKLGFITWALNQPDRYEVEHFEVHATPIWTLDGKEIEVMNAKVCISSFKSYLSTFSSFVPSLKRLDNQICYTDPVTGQTYCKPAPDTIDYTNDVSSWGDNITVMLYYPTKEGEIKSVTLTKDPASFFEGGGCWMLPQTESITDFTSGNYTVVIKVDDKEYKETFYKKIVVGLSTAEVKINYPENGGFITPGNLTVSWNEPVNVEVPEGVKIEYIMNIQGWNSNNPTQWKWWDSGSTVGLITTTNYQPPISFEDGWQYRLCVSPVFTDLSTGEWLGVGKENCVTFTVSESASSIAQGDVFITLNGEVDLDNEAINIINAKGLSCYVAAVSDLWSETGEVTKILKQQKIDLSNCASACSVNYSLVLNATQIRNELTNGAWIYVFAYCDYPPKEFHWGEDIVFSGGDVDSGKWEELSFSLNAGYLYMIKDSWEGHEEKMILGNTTVNGPEFIIKGIYFPEYYEVTNETYNETYFNETTTNESSILYYPTYGSINLADSGNWIIFGTYQDFTNQTGFILGDNDGYTIGDSCWYSWFGYQFDYDVAISKFVFKAPFDINIVAKINPTQYGYNTISVVCVNPEATYESFDNSSCSSVPPFRGLDLGIHLTVGTRWEYPGKLCVTLGVDNATCVDSSATGQDTISIIVDSTRHAQVYINETLIGEEDISECESGYYMLYMGDFETPIYIYSGAFNATEVYTVNPSQ